ncbi:sensor histidine kinase [Dermacoccaceae bacterium W4C1]
MPAMPTPSRFSADALGSRGRWARWTSGVIGWCAQHPGPVLVVITAIALSIAWPTIPATHELSASLWPIFGLLEVLPLLLMRFSVLLGWATSAAGCVLWWLAIPLVDGWQMPWPVMQFLVLLTTIVAVAVRSKPVEIAVVTASTAALMVVAMPTELRAWAIGVPMVAGVGLLLRWLLSSRQQLSVQTQATESERALVAAAQERARIARELHDVVAHHMSMIVVQAQSAPARLGVQDAALVQEFTQIEQAARTSLNEVRGVLGVLRTDDADGGPPRAPQPELGDVPRMVESARAAGMQLTVHWRADAAACPPATGLVAYRIVQEALANAARHAPGQPVTVDVLDQDGMLLVGVSNPRVRGADTTAPLPTATAEHPGGNGLNGMRTRAAAVGGTLQVEAGVNRFGVRASLPLTGRPDPVVAG